MTESLTNSDETPTARHAMSYVMETISRNGMTAEISVDEYAGFNPRVDYDNMWNFVSNCRSIDLEEGELNLDELMEALRGERKSVYKDYIILPVYMYHHSGIALSLSPFGCPWDSGIGFVAYVKKSTLRNEYHTKRVTKDVIERATNYLRGEIEDYDHYLNGEIYNVDVTDEEGKDVESCGGFLGLESAVEFANEILGADTTTKVA